MNVSMIATLTINIVAGNFVPNVKFWKEMCAMDIGSYEFIDVNV